MRMANSSKGKPQERRAIQLLVFTLMRVNQEQELDSRLRGNDGSRFPGFPNPHEILGPRNPVARNYCAA